MLRRAGLFPLALLLAACASGPAARTAPAVPSSGPSTASSSDARSPSRAVPDAPAADEGPALPAAAPDAWQLLDLEAEGVPGVSATRVYAELLAGRAPARTVVVAVIDGGVDTAHVDLRENLWRNPGETPGNGRDDDGNGYVDDVYGWNFLGGADGRNVGPETMEITRLYARCRDGGAPPAGLTCNEITDAYQEEKGEVDQTLEVLDQLDAAYAFALPLLRGAGAGDEPTVASVQALPAVRPDLAQAKQIFLQLAAAGITPADIPEAREAYQGLREYGFDPDFNPRTMVGDDPEDGSDSDYGNGDVMGPDARHGTHVSGIIGAVRGNGIGLDGIAAGVRIMTVRAVPDGDERDKDVANAIRYAVDNGAHVINMSFGKSFSPQKELVDAAIRYADERGVLMIHAAGNDGEDIDVESNFPSPFYADGGRAELWIEVGAANWSPESLAAAFSNFGQTSVDVFAPGVDILSTVPGGEFEREDGTSMASPVVTGVAALLMAYFPELDAAEVRRILLESAVDYAGRTVPQPGAGDPVPFGTLSVTGAVINAYEAVRRAMERM